jgi:hypothetical protein
MRATMLNISADTLREGCDRAHDLFTLNSLREPADAADGFDAVFEALGFDHRMRARLQDTLVELVPVKGDAHSPFYTAPAARGVGAIIAPMIQRIGKKMPIQNRAVCPFRSVARPRKNQAAK